MTDIAVVPELFAGAISIECTGGGLKPWRLPCDRLALFPPDDALPQRAECAAGVRLRLATDATELTVLAAPLDAPRRIDVTIANAMVASLVLAPKAESVSVALPPGQKVVECWLPQTHGIVVRGVRLNDGATATPAPDRRLRWVTYGSSITHCGSAYSPARTWPATVARRLDLNLTCLGYGGNCHLDPLIACLIRDLPADVITAKLGINIYGGASLSPRTFRAGIIGLVRIVREKHPHTPFGLISSIYSPPREDNKNAVGFTLKMMREQVADAGRRLRECGDTQLYSFDGLALFGADCGGYLPDQLHPNGDGYELLGNRIADQVLPKLLAAMSG